jgi:transposase InsO family protein
MRGITKTTARFRAAFCAAATHQTGALARSRTQSRNSQLSVSGDSTQTDLPAVSRGRVDCAHEATTEDGATTARPEWRRHAANQCWSMDFVSDKLADGRSFRILTLVDQFTRECVGLEADRSMTGMKKALRNSIANSRLKPSGTNFTSIPATTAPRIFWHTSVKH